MLRLLDKVLRSKQAPNRAVSDHAPGGRSEMNFFLPELYRHRSTPEYFEDFSPSTTHKVYQPDVYRLAKLLLKPAGTLIDVGCGKGGKLRDLIHMGTSVVGIDVGPNIRFCQTQYASVGRWIPFDLESEDDFPLSDGDFQSAVVVCADVVEHLLDPRPLLRNLRRCHDSGAVVILSTPDRSLVKGPGDLGPPRNPAHTREWTIGEFRELLVHHGLRPSLLGLTANNDTDRRLTTILAVV